MILFSEKNQVYKIIISIYKIKKIQYKANHRHTERAFFCYKKNKSSLKNSLYNTFIHMHIIYYMNLHNQGKAFHYQFLYPLHTHWDRLFGNIVP